MEEMQERSILVIDDSDDLAGAIARTSVGCGCKVISVPSPVRALEMLQEIPVALVVARARPHSMVGIDLAEQVSVHGNGTLVLLVSESIDMPTISRAVEATGTDFITEPISDVELSDKIANMLERQTAIRSRIGSVPDVARVLDSLAHRFQHLADSAAVSLSAALKLTHAPTRAHCERVALRSAALAASLDAWLDDIKAIYLAGLLHDLGKVTVSAAVLDKPGPLDEQEIAQVRSHPETAERIVTTLALPPVTMAAIRHHHEWFDGTGYPDKIAGQEIPFGARVIAVCDAYDAMTSERPYKAALPRETALGRLVGASVVQFDPEIVEAFCRLPEAQDT